MLQTILFEMYIPAHSNTHKHTHTQCMRLILSCPYVRPCQRTFWRWNEYSWTSKPPAVVTVHYFYCILNKPEPAAPSPLSFLSPMIYHPLSLSLSLPLPLAITVLQVGPLSDIWGQEGPVQFIFHHQSSPLLSLPVPQRSIKGVWFREAHANLHQTHTAQKASHPVTCTNPQDK